MATSRTSKSSPRKKAKPAEKDPMLVGVASIMSKRVKSVRPDTSLETAMALLVANDISHLPVVRDGRLVGVLSKTDLVREHFMQGETQEAPARPAAPSLGAGFHEQEDVVRLVSEVMSTRVRSVAAGATVAEAAILMAKYRVHGLPVVDDAGALRGFVSSLDVVRWVAAS